MINQIIDRITDEINSDGSPLSVTYLNIYNYSLLRSNRKTLLTFDKITLDGILLVLFIRLLYRKKFRRVSPDFSSYFKPLFEELNRDGRKVAFIGASDNEIKSFVKIIGEKYSDLCIDFFQNGYNVQADSIADQLKHDNTEFLFVGMGTPKQEQLIDQIISRGYTGWCFCCGAFISQTAKGGENYYPNWINTLHLRWLYRIFQEPKLIRRYALDYPVGILLLLKDRFTEK